MYVSDGNVCPWHWFCGSLVFSHQGVYGVGIFTCRSSLCKADFCLSLLQLAVCKSFRELMAKFILCLNLLCFCSVSWMLWELSHRLFVFCVPPTLLTLWWRNLNLFRSVNILLSSVVTLWGNGLSNCWAMFYPTSGAMGYPSNGAIRLPKAYTTLWVQPFCFS